jgi:pilus assembly protein CpaF
MRVLEFWAMRNGSDPRALVSSFSLQKAARRVRIAGSSVMPQFHAPQRRRKFPNVVLHGGRLFADDFPHWQDICDYYGKAIENEINTGQTPYEILATRQRFTTFLLDELVSAPHLNLTRDHIAVIGSYLHDEFFGMGVIAPWLDDSDVEDIMLDDPSAMYVTKAGQVHRVEPSPWASDESLKQWMQLMLDGQDRTISTHTPAVAGRLDDGSRFQFVVPPIARHPSFSIRKHSIARADPVAYRASGVGSEEFFADLSELVRTGQNIIVSGATGSGKTTLVNYIGGLIPVDERILVLEDTPEIQIHSPRAHYFTARVDESRGGRSSSDESITITDLVRYALRSNPKRVVVGEIRGAEAFDLIRAMSTGHAGGLSTLHANTPGEALLIMEMMASQAKHGMPSEAITQMIGSGVGIAIQMAHEPSTGKRRCVEMCQVINPAQVLDKRVLDECLEVVPGKIYTRTLWLWDQQQQIAVKHADPVKLAGNYFH